MLILNKGCCWAMTDVNLDRLKTVKPVSMEQLNKLHTGSLLTRLQALRSLSLDESFDCCDLTLAEVDAVKKAGLIGFKNSDLWAEAFRDVKAVLAEREHLPKGSKEARQLAAKEKQNR